MGDTPPPPMVNGIPVMAEAPPGWEVDLENPTRTSVWEHYLIFGIMGSFATIALCQRFYTKVFLSKGLWVDDLFMFLAWLTSMATQAMMCAQIARKTLGLHSWEVVLSEWVASRPVTYATAGIFMMCNGFTKISLLTFYLQLSPQKSWKIAIWTSLAFVGTASFVITIMLYVYCNPVEKAYQPQLEGECLNPATLYIATAAANIVTDVLIFILPIPMVLQLRMKTIHKVGALVIFGIGSVTVATSGVRMSYLMEVLNTKDLSWDAARANVWSLIEANLFIICGSMPTTKKFFQHFFPMIMGSTGNTTSRDRYIHYGSGGDRLETIGGSGVKDSRKRRSLYEDMELGDLQASTRNHIQAGPDDDQNSDKAQPDNGSEKAILQTKTVEVRFS